MDYYVSSLPEEYFYRIKQDVIDEIRQSLSIIKSKFIIEHHLGSTKDYHEFYSLLQYQKSRFKDYENKIVRLNSYYKKKLLVEGLTKRREELIKNRLRATGIVYRSFLSLKNILELQEKELDYRYRLFIRGKTQNKIIKKVRSILKHDLYSLIHIEEIHLSLTILIYEKRNRNIVDYNKHIKQLEKLSGYERGLIVSALFFNTLPIHGVGDLLSLPFWAAEGILVMYEHHFKEYHEWKKSKKRNLVDLSLELEKIRLTDD